MHRESVEPETGGAAMDMVALISHAIHKNPKGLELVPINYVLVNSARQNDDRPAYITVYTPDSWVANLRGKDTLMDGYLALRIPRETVEGFINGNSGEGAVQSGPQRVDDRVEVDAPIPA